MKRKDERKRELKLIEEEAVKAAREGKPRSANPHRPPYHDYYTWDLAYQQELISLNYAAAERRNLMNDKEGGDKIVEFTQAKLEALIRTIVQAELRVFQTKLIGPKA